MPKIEQEGAFDHAVRGVGGIIDTASPSTRQAENTRMISLSRLSMEQPVFLPLRGSMLL